MPVVSPIPPGDRQVTAMSDDLAPALKRAALTELRGLKAQFDALAPKYQTLRHYYLVHPCVYGPIDLTAIINERAEPDPESHDCGFYEISHDFFQRGEWHGWYFGETFDKPVLSWEGWCVGQGFARFKKLAETAGNLLTELRVRAPVPPELRARAGELNERFLDELRTRGLVPFESQARADKDNLKATTDLLILPNQDQRWLRFLHWLAWSGGPMAVKRWSWSGIVFEYDYKEIDKFCEGYAPPPRLSFEKIESPYNRFYSVLDNLFLRSSVALQWIMATLSEGLVKDQPRKEADRDNQQGGASGSPVEDHANRPPSTKSAIPANPKELNRLERELLHAIHILRAFDDKSLCSKNKIVKKADPNKGPTSGDVCRAFRRLVSEGFLASAQGRDGGFWLTPKGREVVEEQEAKKRQA